MPEREQSEGQRLLQIKDSIHTYWMQLPPEHQATMALVLIKNTLAGQAGDWLREAIALLDHSIAESDDGLSIAPLQVKVTLTREDINQLPEAYTEKMQFTDEVIRRIEQNVQLNLYDSIWDEIEAVVAAEVDMRDLKK